MQYAICVKDLHLNLAPMGGNPPYLSMLTTGWHPPQPMIRKCRGESRALDRPRRATRVGRGEQTTTRTRDCPSI
jgi:hypothetical protein